jgi:PAS domain S-box-containing protein
MTDESISGDGSRILVLVDGERDRELVAERLDERHEVVADDPEGDWGRVDLCIVDAATYRSVTSRLAASRRESVAYLPVLLLVPDRGGGRGDEWVAEALSGPVDDVLVVPAPRREFDARAEALLRVRRQSVRLSLYRHAMDEADIGITISDPDREDNPLVYVNERFVETTGYSSGEVLGQNCRFLQGPETDETTVAEVREAIDTERPTTVELLNYRADGEPFWNRLTVTPIHDYDGSLTNFLGFQQDVTERVERGRSLERFKTIVQTVREPIVVLDPDGNFERVNEAMTEATGYEADELVGSHVSKVASEADIDRGKRQIRAVLDGTDERATFEASLVAADGSSREYRMSVSVLDGPDGFEGTTLVAHDVTDLREHQRRLSVLDRVLRHNLRNKLNVVVARASEIRDHAEDDRLREAASGIERAGGDLLETAEAVRRFQGVTDPRRSARKRVDLTDAVESALDGIRATYGDVRLEVDCASTAVAAGDETLALAVEELLDNAAGAGGGGDGPTRVSARVRDEPAEGVVEVAVADDGPGIGESSRRALERGTETPLEHTSGLGLWLVRWAVDNANGDICVEQNEPRGTVVRLRLPRFDPGRSRR